MDTKTLEQAKKQVDILIRSDPSCPEIREASQNWLAALGTDREREMTEKLLMEAEEDLESIDGMIAFYESDRAASMFGKEEALKGAEEGRKAKASGIRYCTCESCDACLALLDMKETLLG